MKVRITFEPYDGPHNGFVHWMVYDYGVHQIDGVRHRNISRFPITIEFLEWRYDVSISPKREFAPIPGVVEGTKAYDDFLWLESKILENEHGED